MAKIMSSDEPNARSTHEIKRQTDDAADKWITWEREVVSVMDDIDPDLRKDHPHQNRIQGRTSTIILDHSPYSET